MAGSFSSREAKTMREKHAFLLERLEQAVKLEKTYKERIRAAADTLAGQAFDALLREIPVEELNRAQRGIRTKLLRAHGYWTVADLYGESEETLAAVKGIGAESARVIREEVLALAQQAKKNAVIKLSADRRTREATELVRAVAIYRNSLTGLKACKALLSRNKALIESDMEDLLPFEQNPLKRLFLPREVKQSAAEAYRRLEAMLEETYLPRLGQALAELEHRSHMRKSEAWEDFRKNAVHFFALLEKVCPGMFGMDVQAQGGLPGKLAEGIRKEPLYLKGLSVTLRRYQKWGVKYILHQKRVLLGDEMGLGKTVQAIAAMVSLRNTGATHFAVVCPAGVLANWCREIVKHSDLRAVRVHGSDRESALASWLRAGGVAVTTYETASYFELDSAFRFAFLAVDEAHYIKNPMARRTLHTVRLSEHADRLLFMTGTALENNVDEMITLVRLLQPAVADQLGRLACMSDAPEFREKIAPVYFRRKREDVLTELPRLIEKKKWCSLTPEEELLYEEAVLGKRYSAARRVSWNVANLSNSSKARRLLAIVERAREDKRKVIVFSFFLDTVRRVSLFLGDRTLEPITGSTSPQRRQEIIDEFEKAPDGAVLTAQIQAAGTGLNIQAASVVVFCEPQFKPSIENQAIARAYRMGQTRNVLVYRLLCVDTVDERITELLRKKQAVFDAFADSSEAVGGSAELDAGTFGGIMNAEGDRLRAKRGAAGRSADGAGCSAECRMQLGLSYGELVDYLLKKYGPAEEDYFLDSFTSKNKRVSRTQEGLQCHHIDEDKAVMLSDEEYARRNPFDYQRADRLVYGDLLEHLLLHVKIAEAPRHPLANEGELPGIGGAVYMIGREINQFFDGEIPEQEWKRNVTDRIADRFEDFIAIQRHLWRIVQSDSRYASVSKADLARDWHCRVVQKVYDRL